MTATDFRRLARMTRGVLLSLRFAVDDLEHGHYDLADRERLASYLDRLSAALRANPQPGEGFMVDSEGEHGNMVIDPQRTD